MRKTLLNIYINSSAGAVFCICASDRIKVCCTCLCKATLKVAVEWFVLSSQASVRAIKYMSLWSVQNYDMNYGHVHYSFTMSLTESSGTFQHASPHGGTNYTAVTLMFLSYFVTFKNLDIFHFMIRIVFNVISCRLIFKYKYPISNKSLLCCGACFSW